MTQLLDRARLGLIVQAGEAVAILTEGLERSELLRSRLTRGEVLRQLQQLADNASQIGMPLQHAMPELDWNGWQAMRARFTEAPGAAFDDAFWFACESLVPATLLWLRVYQHSQPELFRMVPAA
jgi:uncharacterized protein with HEPN domain